MAPVDASRLIFSRQVLHMVILARLDGVDMHIAFFT